MPTMRTRIRIPCFVAMATFIVVLGAHPGRLAASYQEPDIVVTTAAELQSALSPVNAGARILVQAGVYDVSQALTVPDGAALVGEGVMIFDQAGLPTGFDPSGRTLLKATAALAGDILTLGDGATVRGLAIEDVVGRVTGGAVAVLSRAPGDFISARIEECEVITPSRVVGTTGRGLVVMTRNPDLEPPDEGAVLRVQMTRSIVRSPGAANGIFAINFASHSQIQLDVESNVVGGTLSVAAGVGLPDAVDWGQRSHPIQPQPLSVRQSCSDGDRLAVVWWSRCPDPLHRVPGLDVQHAADAFHRRHARGFRGRHRCLRWTADQRAFRDHLFESGRAESPWHDSADDDRGLETVRGHDRARRLDG
jgi:hypothetical protein